MTTLRGIGRLTLRAVRSWFAPAPIVSPPLGSTPAAAGIPAYFTERNWAQRRADFVSSPAQSMGMGFAEANAAVIRRLALARGDAARLHVVFNLGAGALLEYLRTGKYMNAYQHPVVNGKKRKPSATRERVDKLIELADPADTYFCALEMGGAGIRFYGEYCAVLKSPADKHGVKRVMDRNSYDLICNPLKSYLEELNSVQGRHLIDGLQAKYRSADCADLLALKVMQVQNGHARLLTMGTIGASLIRDEDYVEAYHEGAIALPALLELRAGGEERAIEASISGRWQTGQVSAEEMLWLRRREAVRDLAGAENIPIRTVSGSGRTQRWK
jgi:hypothetical protein